MTAPYARASAVTLAEAYASQSSSQPSATGLRPDRLNTLRTDYLDAYDSRWNRDPGRSHGPFT